MTSKRLDARQTSNEEDEKRRDGEAEEEEVLPRDDRNCCGRRDRAEAALRAVNRRFDGKTEVEPVVVVVVGSEIESPEHLKKKR